MPPSNNTSATAIVVSSLMLPYTNTQNVHESGITYPVWYRFDATFNGVVGIWGYGDFASAYKVGHDVYSPNATTSYMNFFAVATNNLYNQRPFHIPVENGKSYWILFGPNSGNPNPANLTVSMLRAPNDNVKRGDFITNRELDTDYEHPLTVLAGDESYRVRKFVQMAPPLPGVRTMANMGLPHGDNGVITADGHVIYLDEQWGEIRIYDSSLALTASVSRYNPSVGTYDFKFIGAGASRNTFFVFARKLSDSTYHLDECNTAGTVINTWTITTVAGMGHVAVNADNTRAYFGIGGSGFAIKVWDLVNSVYLPNFETVTGYSIYDILVMPTGEVLACYLGPGGEPKDVIVKRYSPTGTVLNIYPFGAAWRQSFNPPHIGYALDTASFWITLKPYPAYETTLLRNIRISDGVSLTELAFANYLFEEYIVAVATPTPPSRFGPEKSFRVLITTVDGGCPSSISPTSVSVPAIGQNDIVVTVTIPVGCEWVVIPPPWIEPPVVTPPTVTIDVPANPGLARTGTVLIAGQSFVVNQAGLPDLGGIYYINPAKKHDSYYNSTELKKPNPTFRTALLGE